MDTLRIFWFKKNIFINFLWNNKIVTFFFIQFFSIFHKVVSKLFKNELLTNALKA